MKNKLLLVFIFLMAFSVLFVACKNGEEEEKAVEETLPQEETENKFSVLLEDFAKITDVKETMYVKNDSGIDTTVLIKSGEGDEKVVFMRSTSDHVIEGQKTEYTGDTYIWKDGDNYVFTTDRTRKTDGKEGRNEKQYCFLSEEEHAEHFGADSMFNNLYNLSELKENLAKNSTVISGKKITKGEEIKYELSAVYNGKDAFGNVTDAKVEVKLIGQDGKITGMEISETGKNKKTITFEYGANELQTPSLKEYAYYPLFGGSGLPGSQNNNTTMVR